MKDKPKPGRGRGEKNIECARYDECLTIAARKNWDVFHCEDCLWEKGTASMIDSTAEPSTLCKDCGKNPRITPHVPYCPSCMAKRSNRPGTRRKPHKRTKQPSAPVTLQKSKEPAREEPAAQKAALTIQFGKYSQVLKEIERLAEAEMRPVDLQVIYILKQHLEKQP